MKKKIAFFTTGWCCEILSQFISGMQKAFGSEGADIFLFLCYATYGDSAAMKKGEMNIFELPDLRDFDGVVIFGSGLDFKDIVEMILSRCREAGVPVIMQGAEREGISYIGSDNYQATRDLCAHLLERHKVSKIVFFAGTPDSHDSNLRLKAIQDHLEENGCSGYLKEVFYTNWENAAASRRVNELCATEEGLPDAIICANDGLAMESCLAVFNNGYSVPDDVIVTGYDFINDSQIFDPAIASVDQCLTEMGEAAGILWEQIVKGEVENGTSRIIPCRFVPGDSCGCYEDRNSDMIRRKVGRDGFANRSMTTYFNRKLDNIDSVVLGSSTFDEFKRNLHDLLVRDHVYEGDSFHVLLEPNFGLSIYDSDIKMRTKGYSHNREVLYSSEDGVSYNGEVFAGRELIPGYKADGENHLYVFLPLHEGDSVYGYIIFRDCIEKVYNRYLHTYQNRMNLVFEKFRHALTLDQINIKLMDLMRKDPLTGVKNRMAYEDKEKYLQSLVNSESDTEFAIAMFDVNNLKLINDTGGHDAGDDYLKRCCHLICRIFKHSPVYRVGGDEFLAVLCDEDYDGREELRAELISCMSPYSDRLPLPDDYVSIASGIAVYDPQADQNVSDVLKRADEEMYENKTFIKSGKIC